MGLLGQAVHLNNLAAGLIQSGRLVDAATLLHQGVAILRDLDFDEECASLPYLYDVTPTNEPSGQTVERTFPIEQTGQQQDGLAYIYDRSLFFSSNIKIVSTTQLAHLYQKINRFTTFNLALAYHLISIRAGGRANLSHIHFELGKFDLSQYCMDCIVDILCITDCLHETTFLSDDEADAIALNLLLATAHFTMAARAA